LKNNANWSDDDIRQALIEICDERVKHHEEQIAALRRDIEKNRLKLQVIQKLGSIPPRQKMN
jgi:hypothetical protein